MPAGVPQFHLPGGLHREHHPELVRQEGSWEGRGGVDAATQPSQSTVTCTAVLRIRVVALLGLHPCTAFLLASARMAHPGMPPLRRYFGNDKSMLIPNCLFRLGGAAMLLSNK